MQCVVECVVEDLLDGAWHGADEDRRLCASEHKVHLSEFRCRAPGVDPVSGGACEIHGDRRPALAAVGAQVRKGERGTGCVR